MQERIRTEAGAVKLSTMGGVWPAEGFAGAKVYTTIAGRFNFVIVLFSADTGAPLATLEANAITRWRTAAVSVVAARQFARAGADTLALFGTGVQARSHLEAFARAFPLGSIRIVSRGSGEELAAHARAIARCEVRVTGAREALQGANLVVTATRSVAPLFEGAWVERGAFVAAVGSSKPDTRETDDALIARASAIAVEWRAQTLREAGDLLLADPALLAKVPVIELGEALAGMGASPRAAGDVVLFKSVGVGLEDVAAAGLAWSLPLGLFVGFALPFLGWFALLLLERWETTAAALRALGLSLFRRRAFVRLAAERDELVREMTALDALLDAAE
jgi:ornithine cyclodeaminase